MVHEVGKDAVKDRERTVHVRVKGAKRAIILLFAVLALFTYGQYRIGRQMAEQYLAAVQTAAIPAEPEPVTWELQDGMKDAAALLRHVEVAGKYADMVTKALDDNMHIPIVGRMAQLYKGRMRAMVYDPTTAQQPMTAGPVSLEDGKTDLVSIIVFGQAGAEESREMFRYSRVRRGIMIGTTPCSEAWFQASVLRQLFLAYADNVDPEGKQADLVEVGSRYVARQVLAHKTGSRYTAELESIVQPFLSVHWERYVNLVMTPAHIKRLDAIVGPAQLADRTARDEQYRDDMLTYWYLVNGAPDPEAKEPEMETLELGT